MSVQHPLPVSGGVSAPAASHYSALADLVSTLSIIILILTEIWLATIAAIWACAVFLGIGPAGYAVLSLVLLPVAAWASWHTVRLAWRYRNAGNAD